MKVDKRQIAELEDAIEGTWPGIDLISVREVVVGENDCNSWTEQEKGQKERRGREE